MDEILCHTCRFWEGSEQMKKDDPVSYHLLQKSSEYSLFKIWTGHLYLQCLTSLAQCWSQAAHFTHTHLLSSLTADFQTWPDTSFHGRGHETFLHPESGFSNAMCQALETCKAFTMEHLRKSHFLTKRGLRYSCFLPLLGYAVMKSGLNNPFTAVQGSILA